MPCEALTSRQVQAGFLHAETPRLRCRLLLESWLSSFPEPLFFETYNPLNLKPYKPLKVRLKVAVEGGTGSLVGYLP